MHVISTLRNDQKYVLHAFLKRTYVQNFSDWEWKSFKSTPIHSIGDTQYYFFLN